MTNVQRPYRRGRIDLARSTQPPLDPSSGLPLGEGDTAAQDAALAERNALIKAEAADLIARGRKSVLDLNEHADNINGNGTVLTYTIPSGLVGRIERIGVFYSEPIMVDLAEVTLLVSGSTLPYVIQPADFSRIVVGSQSQPFEVSPIYVQANETITVTLANGGTIRYRVTVRLSGTMFAPMTGGL